MAVRRVLDWVDNWEGSGKAVPVVINLSLGNAAGPKDGSGFLEREIARLIDARKAPTWVVLSAGNSYRARKSGDLELAPGEERLVEWCVPPGDKSSSFLELRACPDGALTLELEAPETPPFAVGTGGSYELSCRDETVARLYRDTETFKGRPTTLVTLAVSPTMPLDPPRYRGRVGRYRLRLGNGGREPLRSGSTYSATTRPRATPLRPTVATGPPEQRVAGDARPPDRRCRTRRGPRSRSSSR